MKSLALVFLIASSSLAFANAASSPAGASPAAELPPRLTKLPAPVSNLWVNIEVTKSDRQAHFITGEFCHSASLKTIWAEYNHYHPVTMNVSDGYMFEGDVQLNDYIMIGGRPSLSVVLNFSSDTPDTYPTGLHADAPLVKGNAFGVHTQKQNSIYTVDLTIDDAPKPCPSFTPPTK